jgi:glycosyltransferase involved in cell wall biosynthesis
MFKGKTVSVAMPAYNEEGNVSRAVQDFLKTGFVDEVVVADNNSTDRTAELARKAGARVVAERRQGYGYACRAALENSAGDFIVLVEPDGTFLASDLMKFLVYSGEFDFIIGSRTTKDLVWEGSNMGDFLRVGNWFLGKMIEVLHNGPHLSDVGCTYRLIKRDALGRIKGRFTVGGSHFSPEMIILALRNRIWTLEIPVNYRPRRGESKITGKKTKAFKLGLSMMGLIVSYVFK